MNMMDNLIHWLAGAMIVVPALCLLSLIVTWAAHIFLPCDYRWLPTDECALECIHPD